MPTSRRVDRGRPGDRQRPGNVEVIDGAVVEHDHAGGGVDALVERAQHLVDRARIDLDRRLALQAPHADVERVRAGDHHRRDRRRIVGALVIVDRHQPVHEGARGDQRDVAERAGAAFLLGRQPAPTEALGIADHGVELGVLDRLQHARGFVEAGGERLLDQHRNAALERRHDRIDVQVLVGGDDGAGHFRPLEQFDVALRDEIGADLRRQLRRRGSGSFRPARSIRPRDGAPPPRRGTGRRGRRR